jgi:hypothetical protein
MRKNPKDNIREYWSKDLQDVCPFIKDMISYEAFTLYLTNLTFYHRSPAAPEGPPEEEDIEHYEEEQISESEQDTSDDTDGVEDVGSQRVAITLVDTTR